MDGMKRLLNQCTNSNFNCQVWLHNEPKMINCTAILSNGLALQCPSYLNRLVRCLPNLCHIHTGVDRHPKAEHIGHGYRTQPHCSFPQLKWKDNITKPLPSVSIVVMVTPCRKTRNRCMGRWLKDYFSYLQCIYEKRHRSRMQTTT